MTGVFRHPFSTKAPRLLDRSVALGVSNELIDHEQLEFHLLGRKKYVLAVHLDHPFAAAGAVRIPHLERESFICDYSRMGLEALRRLCQKYGFSPTVEFEVQSSELLFQLVEELYQKCLFYNY